MDYMEEPERVADTEEIYEPPEEHPVREAVQKLPPKYRLVSTEAPAPPPMATQINTFVRE